MNGLAAMLESRFAEPAEWQWQPQFETRNGQFLRFGYAASENPRALVVVFPGLSEYIEKYFEVVRDLLKRGYAVAVIDWRGQGLSWRQENRSKRYHDDFINDVLDARSFLEALPFKNLPRILLAHSMGGNIGLRVMHDYPNMFVCAAMTAPMFGLPVPEKLVAGFISFLNNLGLSNAFLPGHGPWSAKNFALNLKILTTDDNRIAMQKYWMENADLRMGGLTVGWLHAALKSMHLIRKANYLAAAKTPILLVQGTRDRVISNTTIQTAARLLPQAELMTIEGALHEILMERDVYRNRFWTVFDAFLAKHV